MTRHIAIVGGGLSGTLTAVHLMRRAQRDDLHITLVNRSGPLARGVAYGTRSDVTDDHAVVRADGHASQVLHYIGPLLRARYWECTAVPELRGHAQRLAATLCG